MSTAPSVIDGRTVPSPLWRRAGRRALTKLTSRTEREEALLEGRLRSHAGVTRPNVIAVAGPPGAGGTTAATVVGTLLTSHVRARTIVVGASDAAAPVADLLDVATAAELRRHVDALPSGLHRLAAPEVNGQLLAFLGLFYEAIVVDTGMGGEALDRADQAVWVVRPDPATINPVRRAAPDPRATVVLNGTGKTRIEAMIALQRPADPLLRDAIDVPRDAKLGAMLATGTFTVGALAPATRIALKRVGAAVADRLV